MLFFISDDVAQKAIGRDREVVDTLCALGYYWRTGYCLVDGSRKSLELLSEVEELKNDYAQIVKQKQNVVGLYKEIDFFIVLHTKESTSLKMIDGAVGKTVAIGSFKNRMNFGLNIILCENIVDFDFYLWGAKYLSDINGNVFRLSAFGYNGGGGTTLSCATHVKDHLCLIICDNDKKYPEDEPGSTVKRLREYYMAERPSLTWLYGLTVQEAENLIPYCLLCKVYGMRGLIKKMKPLPVDVKFGSFFSFFDYKEGFKKHTLRKMKKENVGSFLTYLSMLKSLGVQQKAIDDTLTKKFRKNENPILPGLGGDILKETVDYLDTHNMSEKIELADYQKEDWDNIRRKIWSIGCANNPRRV
jgi:hypothetical protein